MIGLQRIPVGMVVTRGEQALKETVRRKVNYFNILITTRGLEQAMPASANSRGV